MKIHPGNPMLQPNAPGTTGNDEEPERPPMPEFSTDMPLDDEMRGRPVFLRLLNARSKIVREENMEAGWFYSEEYGAPGNHYH